MGSFGPNLGRSANNNNQKVVVLGVMSLIFFALAGILFFLMAEPKKELAQTQDVEVFVSIERIEAGTPLENQLFRREIRKKSERNN